MHVRHQRWLKGSLPKMHEQHPKPAIDLCIIFISVVGLLLGNHTHAGPMPSKWPTETALVVAVGPLDGVVQAQTLEQIHQRKGLCADRFYLVLNCLCLSHFRQSFKVGGAG